MKYIDTAIFTLIDQEKKRQQETLDLIASENYASLAVMRATGSVLTNKYAEGYPGKRYYGGCQIIDAVEQLAQERAKQLFGAEHVNVQPHAGCQANAAAFAALLQPGDTILGMRLAEGGHLTHGHGVNFSGKIYKAVQYGVHPETELLDYNAIERLAHEHKPKLIIAGASAYSRTIDFERFARIARDVGAYFMADIAHIAGLIAAQLHPSPVAIADVVTSTTHKTLRGPRGGLIMAKQAHATAIDRAIIPGLQGGPLMHVIAAKAIGFYEALQPSFAVYQQQIIRNAQTMAQLFIQNGYRVVTGGTDNHLFVLDLRNKNSTGLAAEKALESVGITVSRSGIPNDTQSPWITSGIRIGTPAITTRGMQAEDMATVVELIDAVITRAAQNKPYASIQADVQKLVDHFPLYSNKE
ncbi:MAG: serine hydroxymethyltransferase [Candidatus Babeliales bacterium]